MSKSKFKVFNWCYRYRFLLWIKAFILERSKRRYKLGSPLTVLHQLVDRIGHENYCSLSNVSPRIGWLIQWTLRRIREPSCVRKCPSCLCRSRVDHFQSWDRGWRFLEVHRNLDLHRCGWTRHKRRHLRRRVLRGEQRFCRIDCHNVPVQCAPKLWPRIVI